MTEPLWLTVEDVLRLHAMQIEEFGGSAGIRDPGLLESAVMRPRHRFHYGELKTIVEAAVAYAVALNGNRPFADGNKRVAFHAMLVFLRLHGLILRAPAAEATEMMLGLAASRFSEAEVRAWVRSRA
jgi:death-on-curing protein